MAVSQQHLIRVHTIIQRQGGPLDGRSGLDQGAARTCTDCGLSTNVEGPVALLARAVGASYADALSVLFDERQLSWCRLEIQTEAACSVALAPPSPESVTVFPAIFGGDPRLRNDYAAAALRARDRSLVGHAIRGNLAYKVAAVTVVAADHHDGFGPRSPKQREPDDPLHAGRDNPITRHLAAFNLHLSDKAAATLQFDSVLDDVALGRRFQGRAEVTAYYRSWWDAFDLRVADRHCDSSGSEIVPMEAHCVGVHVGTFRGIEPTHHPIDLRAAAILRLRDGLIAEMHVYYDASSLLRQLDATATTLTTSFEEIANDAVR